MNTGGSSGGAGKSQIGGKQLAQQIKDRVRVSDVVRTRVVLSKSTRGELEGLCPFHKEKTASFTVSDAKQFYHCFGCGAHGSVIDFAMEVYGLTLGEAMTHLSEEHGLVGLEESPEMIARREQRAKDREAQQAREAAEKRKRALDLFKDSRVANLMATPVKPYLEGRGLNWDVVARHLHALGFLSRHKYYEPKKDSKLSGTFWPVIVTGMQIYDPETDRSPIQAIHRTYLEVLEPGRVIKAPVMKTKKVLAPGTGSAMRFAPAGPVLRLAEGIETALSILQAQPGVPVWAAGSLDRMSSVILPPVVERIELWTDNDMKDLKGLERMLARALDFYGASGVAVFENRAPEGKDWNDVLVGGAS